MKSARWSLVLVACFTLSQSSHSDEPKAKAFKLEVEFSSVLDGAKKILADKTVEGVVFGSEAVNFVYVPEKEGKKLEGKLFALLPDPAKDDKRLLVGLPAKPFFDHVLKDLWKERDDGKIDFIGIVGNKTKSRILFESREEKMSTLATEYFLDADEKGNIAPLIAAHNNQPASIAVTMKLIIDDKKVELAKVLGVEVAYRAATGEMIFWDKDKKERKTPEILKSRFQD